jgi:hypothetical protein
MNVEVFCLKSQSQLAVTVESLLRSHLFHGLHVQRHEIADKFSDPRVFDENEQCQHFLDLFKQSMVRMHDFEIVIANRKGNWYYMGLYQQRRAALHSPYYMEHFRRTTGKNPEMPTLLELFEESMPSVFPAVAIMDRMIMMPHGVGDAIERSRVFPWFVKPVDVGGVVLTDFRSRDSIEEAVQQAASELKSDLRKLCRRHMVARRIKLPDFHELSRLLNVNIEYLRMHEADLLGPVAELSARVVSGAVRTGVENQVVLEIKNESRLPLDPVIITVEGPHGTLKKTVLKKLTLDAGAATQIQFSVTARTSPFCPLEVRFRMDDRFALATPFPIPVAVEVEK